MHYFISLLKTIGSLIFQVIVILFSGLKTVLTKFWKVIILIITFTISILTLKAFKKKGESLE